ncbi:MAG: REP-associated tyrosine transposase [Dehalococcoidia bacterium]
MSQPPHFRINGAIYFITTRLEEKGATLNANERTIVQQTILELANEGKFKLYAYVVMPDHLHLLIEPPEGQISQVVKLIKGRSSRQINRGTLWQKGFLDFVILSESKFKEKFNYIHNNVVKNHLAKEAQDYPHSSASDYRNSYGEVFYTLEG